MSTVDRAELAWLVQAMAEEPAAVIAFVDAVGDQLAATVRHHLRQFGRRDVAADPEEVAGLVWDVAWFLQARAGTWSPDGALPWVWASRGIAKVVADAIGHARADVDLERLDLVACSDGPPGAVDATLADLVDRDGDARVALLRRALATIDCSERDRQVHIEYRQQCAGGDRSPAHTLARLFGLRPDHVRQIDRRVRLRLLALAAADPTFAPLADLPWTTGRPAAPRPPAPEVAA